MINDNSRYLALHFDRLNEEFLENMFGKHDDEQLNILERRLVSGEITKGEFDKMKEDLAD
jgi:uncharacterized membrane protein